MNLYKTAIQLNKYTKRLSNFNRAYSNKNIIGSVDYCINIVRQHDYENFLATLLMHRDIRSPALVIRAFNVEIARIQDQTSDSQTAAFRLQFWKDVLQKIYINDQLINNIPANPVAQELYKVCKTYKLTKRYLDKLLTSRDSILKKKYFHTLEDIEQYAEDTVSAVYYLILNVAGVTNVQADHAASHLGKAQGITNVLRSVRISSQHKTVIFPMDILMKYNISQETVLRGIDNEQMRNVTFDIASRANNHLKKARSILVPKLTKQIFLPATAVDLYLSKLQKCQFNVFDNSLQQANVVLPFSLYYKRFFNRY